MIPEESGSSGQEMEEAPVKEFGSLVGVFLEPTRVMRTLSHRPYWIMALVVVLAAR